MAAGLGFKTFTTGEVLTAADTNGYLMQGVLVFATAAARDAAITSPQEGQFAFTKDTNGLWYYDGAAWVASGATGDIEGVTAGTGISGGGTSGTVTVSIDTAVTVDKTTAQTLTNKTLTSPALTTPTISTLTTNGDLVYGTGSGALSRLGIGSSAQVLTVSGGLPAWSTAAGGGKVLQVVSATYSTATTMSSTSYAASGLTLAITPTLNTSKILVLVSQPVRSERAQTQNGVAIKLSRGATSIYTLGDSDGRGLTTTANGANFTAVNTTVTFNYLDSPATTSSTTYSIAMKLFSTADSGTAIAQWQSDPASIVLLEIGA